MAGTGVDQGGEASLLTVGMRLNQLPADVTGPTGPSGPSGGPNLASSPAEKKAAAKAIEDDIQPGTDKAGRWADHETEAAIKAFGAKDGDGWLTSGSLKKAHAAWGEQVKNLVNRLDSEKIALRSSSNVLTGSDVAVGSAARQSSVLDGF
jgi:hypothetical protein